MDATEPRIDDRRRASRPGGDLATLGSIEAEEALLTRMLPAYRALLRPAGQDAGQDERHPVHRP